MRDINDLRRFNDDALSRYVYCYHVPCNLGDLSRFWLFCLDPKVVLLRTLLNYSAFKSFDFEGT
jgi:hypothetical protein